MTTKRNRPDRRTVLRGAVAAMLVAALATAGAMTLAQASSTVQQAVPVATAATTDSTMTELLPTPTFPAGVIPALPEPSEVAEPVETTSGAEPSDHCDDPAWWNARDAGDPSDYVAACGTWPSWVDRGETECLPDEQDCPVATSGAEPYTGPTEGRDWSPEYGYYEGRTDGPKNSNGEPCMQGRDNDDPNC